MKQLSVTTTTRDKKKKSDLIRRCLQGHEEGLNPKAIATKAGLNVNTVKSLLPQIKGVKRVTRGWYKVVDDPHPTLDLVDWNFHNLVMTVGVDVPDFSFSRDFLLGRVDVSATRGKATLRLSTDFPLNVSSIAFVAMYFGGVVPGVCLQDIVVSTVEFNHDYRNLRLDGVKCITVGGLVSEFKAYQKTSGLRLEHKTKVPLSMESVVDMLKYQPNAVELHAKLNQHRESLQRLVAVTEQNTALLHRFIDKLGGREL